MLKFRKGYNFKIISITIGISLLFSATLYPCPISKDSLRVSVGEKLIYERMSGKMHQKEQNKGNNGEVALYDSSAPWANITTAGLSMASNEFITEHPVKRRSILKAIGITVLSTMFYSLFSCNRPSEKSYVRLAQTNPNEALMKFEEYKEQPFVHDIVKISMGKLGEDIVIDEFHNYPPAFWEYVFSEIWKNKTESANQEESQAAKILDHIADGSNQNQKREVLFFLAERYSNVFLQRSRHYALWEPSKWEDEEFIKRLYVKTLIDNFTQNHKLGDLFWAGKRVTSDGTDRIQYVISLEKAQFTIDAVKSYGGAKGDILIRVATLKDDPKEVLSLINDIWEAFRTKGTLEKEEAFNLLRYISLDFIREINDLHDEGDEVRFASLKDTPSLVLYLLIVFGEEELYTSSFNGVFDRFMSKLSDEGITLQEFLVNRDYTKFRTLIKMCSWYDRLSDLLGMASKTFQTSLLQRFIKYLELEDDPLSEAVTVADSFNYIKEDSILTVLQKTVKSEYERVEKKEDYKTVVIYGLLTGISAKRAVVDKDWFKNIGKKYELPDLRVLSKDRLFDSKGVNTQRYFFYNDKDGKLSFENFLSHYKNDSNWDIEENDGYVRIVSQSGKIVEIYANRPEHEDIGQQAIDAALTSNKRNVSVVIHRGHSYSAERTMKKIPLSVVFVGLGSCGGYKNVKIVLDKSREAHILSTKGTGTKYVNDPLLKMVNETIRKGQNIVWGDLWARAEERLGKNPHFGNYVQPDRNLGVLFIKAYNNKIDSLIKLGIIKDVSITKSDTALIGALGIVAWQRITDRTDISRRNFLFGGLFDDYKEKNSIQPEKSTSIKQKLSQIRSRTCP